MFVALIPYAIVFTIDCVGWRLTFGPGTLKDIPFRVVWSIRLIGEAINNVIPSMYVGEATWESLRAETQTEKIS